MRHTSQTQALVKTVAGTRLRTYSYSLRHQRAELVEIVSGVDGTGADACGCARVWSLGCGAGFGQRRLRVWAGSPCPPSLVGGCSPACEYTVLAPFVLLEGQGRLGAKSRRRVAGGQRLRAKGIGIGNFGGGWLEQPRQWLGIQWPGNSVAWECRAA